MRIASTRGLALIVAGGLAMATVACSPPQKKNSDSSGAATATSAAGLGGMDKLVAAAKKEGTLNVIALPPDWANYGEIIKAFSDKYGIKVNSAQPDAASQDEINAANQLKGQGGAPDVFDLGTAVALANTDKYAPYKVAAWNDIPDALKDANGTWVNDYGGYMSIGYDASKVPAPTTVTDLLGRRTRARSRSTATRPRPAPRSTASSWRRSATAARPTTSPRASTSSIS